MSEAEYLEQVHNKHTLTSSGIIVFIDNSKKFLYSGKFKEKMVNSTFGGKAGVLKETFNKYTAQKLSTRNSFLRSGEQNEDALLVGQVLRKILKRELIQTIIAALNSSCYKMDGLTVSGLLVYYQTENIIQAAREGCKKLYKGQDLDFLDKFLGTQMFSFYLEEIFFAKTTKMKDTKGIKDLKGEDENNKEKFDADHFKLEMGRILN